MSIGVWQVILILIIVLIIFGAGKLPRVMGDVAKGIKNFKAGMSESESKDDSDGNDRPGNDDGKTIEGSAAQRTDSTVNNSSSSSAEESKKN